MSHKIKLNLKDAAKNLEDLPNQKISISLEDKKKIKTKVSIDSFKQVGAQKKKQPKLVTHDQQLFKQFKKGTFFKVDLHGLTVDEAHQTLAQYLKKNFIQKNLLHIVITGLGNKSTGGEFFTGKIRKQFPIWLETDLFQKHVKSYSACKIQHGGLGAFYIKLKTKE